VELSFRLLSRRGDTFEVERSCIDLTDIEFFVRQRYNQGGKGKKSEKWVGKKAVDLYSHIDADMSGGISYQEVRWRWWRWCCRRKRARARRIRRERVTTTAGARRSAHLREKRAA
jgi:hypothetical protein